MKYLSVSQKGGTRGWTILNSDGKEILHRIDGPAIILDVGLHGIPLVKKWMHEAKSVEKIKDN